jgi:hypothetical protein
MKMLQLATATFTVRHAALYSATLVSQRWQQILHEIIESPQVRIPYSTHTHLTVFL